MCTRPRGVWRHGRARLPLSMSNDTTKSGICAPLARIARTKTRNHPNFKKIHSSNAITMVTTHELRRQVLLLALFLCIPFPAHAASLTSRYASVASYYDHGIHHSSRRRKTNMFATRRRGLMPTSGWNSGSDIAQLVSSTRSTSKKTRQSRTNSHPPPSNLDDFPEEYSRDRDVTYRDLSPLGKLIAGTVEVSIATVLEYMTGFIGGYTLGALTDIPRLLFRAADPTQATPLPLLQEISLRTQRMNAKSLGWAKK